MIISTNKNKAMSTQLIAFTFEKNYFVIKYTSTDAIVVVKPTAAS